MTYLFFIIGHLIQKILLLLSYFICKIFVKEEPNLWIIGVDEIANNTHNISAVFDKTMTVNLNKNKYYMNNSYDFDLKKLKFGNENILRGIIGPILLGYLANRATHFFYIGSTGFLVHHVDGRNFEFKFLKDRNKKIVTFFCGSDIRAIDLSIKHGELLGLETMASYLKLVRPDLFNQSYETLRKKIAGSADSYADHIFNLPVDQISYIKRDVLPFLYFHPDNLFEKNDVKFLNMDRIKIVHAPTSPLIKGTQLVRAAIKNLEQLGYKFDYVEITNSDNAVVLSHLKDAHIVMNEFYAFVPGLFGVEAMALHCALLTSGDRTIEPNLPEGANEAWFVTRYWQVFDHLKLMLDHPERIKPLADLGYDWAYQHCRTSQSQQQLHAMLKL